MAERDSWASMNGATRTVDAEDTRIATAALWTPGSTLVSARQGLRPGPGNPFKVAATVGPSANVTAQLGQQLLTATRGFGSYIATLDATKTLAILDVPADPSLQRNDLIIAKQTDTYYSDGSTVFLVQRVQGTAGAGDPSLAAFSDYMLLARVRVTAGATTVTNAMIDDLRGPWTVALGGLLPVADATARTAITTPYDGQQIYRQDQDWVEVYDGAAWRVQGVAVVANAAGLSAITSPYNGQQAYNSALNVPYQYRSGAWGLMANVPFPLPTQTGSGALGATATATIATVSIPDLGVPYIVEAQGQLETTTPATGNPSFIQVTDNSTTYNSGTIGADCPGVGAVVGIDTVLNLAPRRSASLSGAHTIRLLCKAGANPIIVGTSNYNLTVRAVPVLP